MQKTFPDIPYVSQMHGGPSLRHGDTKEGKKPTSSLTPSLAESSSSSPFHCGLPLTPRSTQVGGHAAVRHRMNAVALGMPLVDEKVVYPSIGRQRHVLTIVGAQVKRWNEHLGLLKQAPLAETLHDRVSKRTQCFAPYHRSTSAPQRGHCVAIERRFNPSSHTGDHRSNTWQQPTPVSRCPYLTWD